MEISSNLNLAIKAAKASGVIIQNGYGQIKSISEKMGKGIVTDVDQTSEKEIIKILQSGSDYPIIAEESGLNGKEADIYWVVDPLDGTTNFSREIPFFGISIALIKNNAVVIGVVFNPVTNECFYAEKNGGAFKNDEKIHISGQSTFENSVMAINCGYGETSREIYGKTVKEFIKSSSIRTFGSTALELCLVAQGSNDGFLSSGDELWDYAAGLLIVEEAGGKVSDWKGESWNNRNSYILATNGHLQNELIAITSQYQQ